MLSLRLVFLQTNAEYHRRDANKVIQINCPNDESKRRTAPQTKKKRSRKEKRIAKRSLNYWGTRTLIKIEKMLLTSRSKIEDTLCPSYGRLAIDQLLHRCSSEISFSRVQVNPEISWQRDLIMRRRSKCVPH